MKKLTYFFLLLWCINLNGDNYIELSDKITAKNIKYAKKKYNLYLTGFGGGMMDNIKSVSLTYASSEYPSLERARKIMVDLAENILNMYNTNQKIRPFLNNYPFNIENIDITITFNNLRDFNKNKENSVCLAYSLRNDLGSAAVT